MVNGAIHRVIEQQAAAMPETIAVVDRAGSLTYRELNQRANTLARRLGEGGLTRGGVAVVRMERGIDLAVVLLAVLKAGAAYTWVEPGSSGDSDLPPFCIMPRRAGGEQPYLALDIRGALAASATRPSPNLPILTRSADIACVLPDGNGEPHVLVPHSTVTALSGSSRGGQWSAEAGAFDLWLGLMTGDTVTIGPPADLPATARTSAAA